MAKKTGKHNVKPDDEDIDDLLAKWNEIRKPGYSRHSEPTPHEIEKAARMETILREDPTINPERMTNKERLQLRQTSRAREQAILSKPEREALRRQAREAKQQIAEATPPAPEAQNDAPQPKKRRPKLLSKSELEALTKKLMGTVIKPPGL